MRRRSRSARLLGLLVLIGTALASPPSIAEPPVLTVYTVNYPLTYFAERIGGDAVMVRFPAPGQIDPAFWKPAPEIIAAYQSADLILLNGAGFARWIGQASLPRRKLVDTSRSLRDAYLPGEDGPHTNTVRPETTHMARSHSRRGWTRSRRSHRRARSRRLSQNGFPNRRRASRSERTHS